MTNGCIDTLKRLRENPDFDYLSAEALIYEAIKGVGIEDVRTLVDLIERDIKEEKEWVKHDTGA